MKWLSTQNIRDLYLSFFESKGHLRFPSDSLIPTGDPTLMFTVAGMVQFKPQFMGAVAKFSGFDGVWNRVATCQKCIRIGDIENVGRTNRHNSLFEMLGNFSFGDYFKKEAIQWAWEFLTSPEYLALESSRLYVTVYKDDDEAYNYWRELGVPAEKIHRFDADENFWPANAPLKGPNGPCGPCSEIYYDRGEDFGSDTWADYYHNPESTRFLEIWNLVFPQFNRQDGGVLEPLPKPNIDTGMGLYRVAAIMQDVRDFYSTDEFKQLIAEVEQLSGKAYQGEQSVSHRVVAEHVRTVTFALTDGVILSNTGRGYVTRKVLRRACRHAYMLGLNEPVLYKLVPLVVKIYGSAYPELVGAASTVQNAIQIEEKRFLQTLANGIERLDTLLSGKTLSGQDAFTLYDTYGFPLDLTEEIAAERGIAVDKEGFEVAYKEQQQRARAASKFGKQELFAEVASALDDIAQSHGETAFVGYDHTRANGKVLGMVLGSEQLSKLNAGQKAVVILDQTPFYAEGGGQVGDTGVLEFEGGHAEVHSTQKVSGLFVHHVEVKTGTLEQGSTVQAVVSPARKATERHHTATHLLQAALRAVLGDTVRQAGSLVSPERLRFDYTHNQALTPQNIAEVERIVNRFITSDFAVNYAYMAIDDARKTGAMALFGEKYGDTVRVVSVEGKVENIASKELCGGTHVGRTGEIGTFVLVSDENLAAGVRRIEALCGEAATVHIRKELNTFGDIANKLNTSTHSLPERVAQLQHSIKDLNHTIENLKRELAKAQVSGNSGQNVQELGGFKVASLKVVGLETGALRGAADSLMDASGADIVVVAGENGLVVKASKNAVANGANAGKIIAILAAAGGGKGGGRPDMAQAGIQNPEAALNALGQAFA